MTQDEQQRTRQGILLAIGNDIKLLETPGVPAAWREPALATVKNALKHLKKLSVNKQIIDALQASLNTKEHAA